MKKYSTILVEDEVHDVELLQGLLRKHSQIDVVGVAEDIENAIAAIVFHKPDLIFFDVGLYGREAFVVLDIIRQYELNPCIIFTTVNDKYLKDALRYSAFEFLLKPVDIKELEEAINRLQQLVNNNFARSYERFTEARNNLLIPTADGFLIINPDEIVCVIADKGYTNIYLDSEKSETVSLRIGQIEEKLSAELFFRVHRSYLINIDKLIKVSRSKCVLRFGSKTVDAEITRENKNRLKELLKV